MNDIFKEEFMHLDPNEIKRIVNGCAGMDILESNVKESLKLDETSYFIKHIDDENYGFWVIEWRYKKIFHPTHMPFSTGSFENGIKITPFKLEFENINSSFNPFINLNKRKQLEEYIFIYINKCCKHYIEAILEETNRFINMISIDPQKKHSK